MLAILTIGAVSASENTTDSLTAEDITDESTDLSVTEEESIADDTQNENTLETIDDSSDIVGDVYDEFIVDDVGNGTVDIKMSSHYSEGKLAIYVDNDLKMERSLNSLEEFKSIDGEDSNYCHYTIGLKQLDDPVGYGFWFVYVKLLGDEDNLINEGDTFLDYQAPVRCSILDEINLGDDLGEDFDYFVSIHAVDDATGNISVYVDGVLWINEDITHLPIRSYGDESYRVILLNQTEPAIPFGTHTIQVNYFNGNYDDYTAEETLTLTDYDHAIIKVLPDSEVVYDGDNYDYFAWVYVPQTADGQLTVRIGDYEKKLNIKSLPKYVNELNSSFWYYTLGPKDLDYDFEEMGYDINITYEENGLMFNKCAESIEVMKEDIVYESSMFDLRSDFNYPIFFKEEVIGVSNMNSKTPGVIKVTIDGREYNKILKDNYIVYFNITDLGIQATGDYPVEVYYLNGETNLILANKTLHIGEKEEFVVDIVESIFNRDEEMAFMTIKCPADSNGTLVVNFNGGDKIIEMEHADDGYMYFYIEDYVGEDDEGIFNVSVKHISTEGVETQLKTAKVHVMKYVPAGRSIAVDFQQSVSNIDLNNTVLSFTYHDPIEGELRIFVNSKSNPRYSKIISFNPDYSSVPISLNDLSIIAGGNYTIVVYYINENQNDWLADGIVEVTNERGFEPVDPNLELLVDSVEEGTPVCVVVRTNSSFTGSVKIVSRDYNASVKVVSGEGNITLSLPVGEYSFKAVFEANDVFNASEKTVSFNVTVKPAGSNETNITVPAKIIAKDLQAFYTDATYSVTVYGTDGKTALKDTQVIFKVNGKNIGSAKTDARGIATLKLAQIPGNYKITAEALGVAITKKLTVKHIVSLKTVKVKKSAKKLVISVTVKVGKKAISKKRVTLKFNGKKLTAKTNKKGVAKFTIKKNVLKKLKVGKKVTYTATYLKDTVKKTVRVKK